MPFGWCRWELTIKWNLVNCFFSLITSYRCRPISTDFVNNTLQIHMTIHCSIFFVIRLLRFSKYIRSYVKYSQTCILALRDIFNNFESSKKFWNFNNTNFQCSEIVPKLFRATAWPGPARLMSSGRAGPGHGTHPYLQWQHRTCQSDVNVEDYRSALKTKQTIDW